LRPPSSRPYLQNGGTPRLFTPEAILIVLRCGKFLLTPKKTPAPGALRAVGIRPGPSTTAKTAPACGCASERVPVGARRLLIASQFSAVEPQISVRRWTRLVAYRLFTSLHPFAHHSGVGGREVSMDSESLSELHAHSAPDPPEVAPSAPVDMHLHRGATFFLSPGGKLTSTAFPVLIHIPPRNERGEVFLVRGVVREYS